LASSPFTAKRFGRIPTELKTILLSRDLNTIKQALDQLAYSKKADVRELFVDEQTNLHESIHLVQAVIYPYLRWYSTLLFKQIFDIFKATKNISQKLIQQGEDAIVIPSLMLLELDYYVWELNDRELGISLSKNASPEEGIPLIHFNIVDLLENAASLIQYKMSMLNDFPTWIEFQRWSKRNPAYTRIIEFVGTYLGSHDLALRIFAALVQVAFETNRPARAFIVLLGAFRYNLRLGNLDVLVDSNEPCRWIDLFDSYMDKTKFEDPDYGNLESAKFFRLERYATSNIRVGGRIGHPIIGYFAKLWGELEQQNLTSRYAFTAPNGYKRQIGEIIEIFRAPIALLKFSLEGENVVLVTGDLNYTGIANLSGMTLDEAAIKSGIVDYLAIFGFVRRFADALMDPDFRLCHHIDCPLYPANFCNSWIFVPAKFENCGFEKHISQALANADRADQSSSQVIIRPISGARLLEEEKDG